MLIEERYNTLHCQTKCLAEWPDITAHVDRSSCYFTRTSILCTTARTYPANGRPSQFVKAEDHCRWTVIFQITITGIWNAEEEEEKIEGERVLQMQAQGSTRKMGRTHQVPVEKLNVGLALAGAAPASCAAWLHVLSSLLHTPAPTPTIKKIPKKNLGPPLCLYFFSAPAFFCCRWNGNMSHVHPEKSLILSLLRTPTHYGSC